MSRKSNGMLALVGVLAMMVAFPLGMAVLFDHAAAFRLETGSLPPGADLTDSRIAAIASIAAVGTALVATSASRLIIPIMLVLAACAPFTLMSLFTLPLAF
ncbi:hypothetical protein [Mycobacterium sp. SMC-19]|uniref:hypothetical protein n=1 Tax=Mycobacterium sp. SMC-19 TaxID=3381630 RepID=UPI0038777046